MSSTESITTRRADLPRYDLEGDKFSSSASSESSASFSFRDDVSRASAPERAFADSTAVDRLLGDVRVFEGENSGWVSTRGPLERVRRRRAELSSDEASGGDLRFIVVVRIQGPASSLQGSGASCHTFVTTSSSSSENFTVSQHGIHRVFASSTLYSVASQYPFLADSLVGSMHLRLASSS